MKTQMLYDKTLLWIEGFLTELLTQLRQNAALVVISFTTYFLTYVVAQFIDQPIERSIRFYLLRTITDITPVVVSVYLLSRAIYNVFIARTDQPTRAFLSDVSSALLNPKRYARFVVLMLIATFGFYAFVNFKIFIPDLIPYYADTAFMRLDKFLHFGRLPSEWLSPLVNSEWIIYKLDWLYKLWYIFMFCLWGWAAWGVSDDGWKRQYVLSFILCWIIGGIVFATLLASGGPCYYGGLVSGFNPYADQMSTLQSYHENKELLAVSAQALLWDSYTIPDAAFRAGISAMPSLHNTLAALFVIAGYKIHKFFGHMMFFYMIIVFIGSIVLGWHYAVDGYAGFVLAIAMWKLAGWILNKQDKLLCHNLVIA